MNDISVRLLTKNVTLNLMDLTKKARFQIIFLLEVYEYSSPGYCDSCGVVGYISHPAAWKQNSDVTKWETPF